MDNVQKPGNLTVIHHRQNPLEFNNNVYAQLLLNLRFRPMQFENRLCVTNGDNSLAIK
jgi:hypothetical protein